MSMITRRASFLSRAGFVLLFSASGVAQVPQARPNLSSINSIQFSFKRDPRLVDPFRGQGPWVTGTNYTGATAQDTVEVRVEGVNGAGRATKVNAEWIVSDPGMVAVSPSQGDDVNIKVLRAGESKLKVSYQGISEELAIRAKYEGKFMLFEISRATAAKPNAAASKMSSTLTTKKEEVSYAVGMNLAKTLQRQSVEIDPDLVRQGFKDALAGGETLMSEEQSHLVLTGVVTEINITEAEWQQKAIAENNKKEGQKFLAENREREGVVTLPNGLQYKVIKAGDGKKPTLDEVAVCHYRGMFLDGTEFDNSYKHKNPEPVTFPVRNVIKGWQEALQLMPAGSKWELFVPPDLAYGERGAPRARIGPNTTLKFEVELLSVGAPYTQAQVSSPNARPGDSQVPPDVIEALKKLVQEAAKQEAKSEKKVENQ
jgi:FKBP-type peptidyl-prolyl cis-trans isomerase FklB